MLSFGPWAPIEHDRVLLLLDVRILFARADFRNEICTIIGMKSGAIVTLVLALVLIAVVGAGLHAWRHQEKVSAEYKPLPAFTDADKFYAQKAHDLIKTAMVQDQEAEARSNSRSVRVFARDSATGEEHMLDRLEKTVAEVNPDFVFQPLETIEPRKPSPDRNVDRDYLRGIIRTEERALSLIEDTSAIQHSPWLLEFTAIWRADVDGRLQTARSLLAALLETSCP